ncbi:MAG: ABC transporter ATP-binding protein [Cyanobacteria bacterium J06648_16]
MHSTPLLVRSILRYPLLVVLSIVFGFSGALFNGIGTILIVPVLLELLDQGGEFQRSFPPLLKAFVDLFQGLPEVYQLPAMGGSIILMIVLKNLSGYFSSVVSGTLNRKLSTTMRKDGLQLLLSVDLDYFSKTRVGDLINNLNTEINRTTIAIRNLIRIATLALTIAVFLLILVITSWELTLISVVALSIVVFLNQFVVKYSKQFGRQLSEYARAYTSRVFEVISGIRLVKATANEDTEYRRLEDLIVQRERAEFRSQLLFAGVAPFNEVANICALLAIATLGRLAFSDQLEYFSSVLLTYLLVLFRMMPFIGQINSTRNTLANTSPSVEIVSAFLNRDNKPFMPQGHREYSPLQQGIHFNRLSFAYPGHDVQVLKEVDLYLPKGKTLALVGASGAGKSTLADLLPRFYDPTAGSIDLDGIDLRTFNVQSYRRNLGIVSQDTFLFNASIEDNLRYGRPQATYDELLDAAKRANAYEFIERLPNGFDTLIGDRGVLLSGGQRQRLAIARALLQDPDVLILDEATSALDTISERLVQRAIEELSRERTTLIIAHRLSTIHKADQIAVMDQGRVVETGTHLELLRQSGAYAKLHAMQFTEETKANGNGHENNGQNTSYRKLVAASSYELRSELNRMLGCLNLLSDQGQIPLAEQEEFVASAYNSAVDLLGIVERLENTGLVTAKSQDN